jgi:hypothetical protein
MMRKLILAAAGLVLLTGAANAQFPMPSISLGGDKPPPTPEQVERQKALDNAYNSANKKIPDKQQAADPWGTVRSNPSPSPQAKTNPNPPQAKKTPNSPQAKNNPNPP